jgi:hypothetical protein
MSAAIIKDHKPLWASGFGFADVQGRVPATPETLYHIASFTKTFAATLVMQLVEQGKLDLDKPVSQYCPAQDPGWRTSRPQPRSSDEQEHVSCGTGRRHGYGCLRYDDHQGTPCGSGGRARSIPTPSRIDRGSESPLVAH